MADFTVSIDTTKLEREEARILKLNTHLLPDASIEINAGVGRCGKKVVARVIDQFGYMGRGTVGYGSGVWEVAIR
jgi:hypothetical protein